MVDQVYSICESYPITIHVTYSNKNLYIGYEVNTISDNNSE